MDINKAFLQIPVKTPVDYTSTFPIKYGGSSAVAPFAGGIAEVERKGRILQLAKCGSQNGRYIGGIGPSSRPGGELSSK